MKRFKQPEIFERIRPHHEVPQSGSKPVKRRSSRAKEIAEKGVERAAHMIRSEMDEAYSQGETVTKEGGRVAKQLRSS